MLIKKLRWSIILITVLGFVDMTQPNMERITMMTVTWCPISLIS